MTRNFFKATAFRVTLKTGFRHGLGNYVCTEFQVCCFAFITLIFYKNVLDRFWEKIKKFCKITFSAKVLKWEKMR